MSNGFKFTLTDNAIDAVIAWGAGEADDIASALRAAKKNHLRAASAASRFTLKVSTTDGSFASLDEVTDVTGGALVVAYALQVAVNEITGKTAAKDAAKDADNEVETAGDPDLSVSFE